MHRVLFVTAAWTLAWIAAAFAGQPPVYDVIIRNGTVYDGTGAPGGGSTSASVATASPRSETSPRPPRPLS